MIGSVFSLSNSKLCTHCKHYIKPTGKKVGTCSLFPISDNQYLDCVRSRKIYYMCGEKGRYYEDVFLMPDSVHPDHYVDHPVDHHPVDHHSVDHPVDHHSVDHPVDHHSVDHSVDHHSVDHSVDHF